MNWHGTRTRTTQRIKLNAKHNKNQHQLSTDILEMKKSATCKAIVFTAINNVEFLDIAMPEIEAPTDVVLRVLACGICGSDLHPFHGREGTL